MSSLDLIVILVKFVSFLCVFVSAGGTLFYCLYRLKLDNAGLIIREASLRWAVIAFIISIFSLSIAAARFAGSYEGIIDFELQKMILLSHLGVARLVSILGLITIIISYKLNPNDQNILATIGISLVAFSFTYTGHTAENSYRLFLAPLLMLHVFVVLFWFGSLIPLTMTIKFLDHKKAGKIVNDFSKKATILVPLIFVAGVIMSIILMDGMNLLSHSYGLIILLKISLYCVLMLIAALNKWRFGPALVKGRPFAAENLNRAILIEILMITLIIGATTVLTSYFSPTTN